MDDHHWLIGNIVFNWTLTTEARKSSLTEIENLTAETENLTETENPAAETENLTVWESNRLRI